MASLSCTTLYSPLNVSVLFSKMAAFDLDMFEDVELHDTCVDAVECFRQRSASFVMFHLSRRKRGSAVQMRIKPDPEDSGG